MESFKTLLDDAMRAQTQDQAVLHLARIVGFLSTHWPDHTPEEIVTIALDNLGYWAGYAGRETRARVERLYGCEHPIFGTLAEHGEPSAELALEIGKRLCDAGGDRDKRAEVVRWGREMMLAERAGKAGAMEP
jgi:hypothetical protein